MTTHTILLGFDKVDTKIPSWNVSEKDHFELGSSLTDYREGLFVGGPIQMITVAEILSLHGLSHV